ncbi:transcriptional regulator, XRE family [Nitrosococcus oceani ATCC 19707]|uniref:Transcriptional regulator, XRE family n=2 Tax=Nitrosococcus oceani TaxID=1229 RepID=Q3J7K5_NITOC|nr:NadS family protein [Nitrosococcus oceani]ABA59191.1 transcriptional regulator, XRE family [Nitrosococcus oceani ATCC 19707]KFI18359.1 DNA-binding protein [Nitrosococcus oceani C-27]GEM20279.1 transcriptional regulator [Nitrosococcus oceani]
MSEAFESIQTGLKEAIAHAKGKNSGAVVHEFSPVDVKAVRKKVGMSQREFAASFGISLGTLRHWEQGDRQPHGPARVLLKVVAKEPKLVLSVLAR